MERFFGQSTQEPVRTKHSGISVLIAAADQVNKDTSNPTTPQG